MHDGIGAEGTHFVTQIRMRTCYHPIPPTLFPTHPGHAVAQPPIPCSSLITEHTSATALHYCPTSRPAPSAVLTSDPCHLKPISCRPCKPLMTETLPQEASSEALHLQVAREMSKAPRGDLLEVRQRAFL